MQDCWGEVDVAGWQLINHPLAEVGAGGDERVVTVEWTEAGMDAPSRTVAAVADDRAGDLRDVLVGGPSERDGDVRRVRCIDADLIEGKSPRHRFTRENCAREILRLKKFDNLMSEFGIVTDDVGQLRSAVADHQDVAVDGRPQELAHGI